MSEDFLSKPFVIGSIAHWLGKKAEESKSHEWTVFLRSASPDEDISIYVKKVVFILHPTLQPPTRSAHSPLSPTPQQGDCRVLLTAAHVPSGVRACLRSDRNGAI